MVLRFAAALTLAASIAACGFVEDINPPSLQLEPLPPRMESNLPRGDYPVTNGNGDVLLEAEDVAPEQEHEARFDHDKLDGTIKVTVTKDGETTYTQELEHTPGVPVRLVWNIDLGEFLLAEVENKPSGPRTSGEIGRAHV